MAKMLKEIRFDCKKYLIAKKNLPSIGKVRQELSGLGLGGNIDNSLNLLRNLLLQFIVT